MYERIGAYSDSAEAFGFPLLRLGLGAAIVLLGLTALVPGSGILSIMCDTA